MQKILITIIAFFILSLTYGQNISQQQLNYIHKKSKSLLEEYEQYFNLVGDINEPHNDREGVYIPSFTGLFIDEAAIHYNDLDPEEKTSAQLPINQYALNTMLWYPVGVRNMLELLDIKYGKVQQISSNSYYINVYINRTISGIFMDEKPNRSTTKLEFRVSFVPNGQLFNDFRIAGVTLAGENIVLDNTPTSDIVNNTSKTNTVEPNTFIDPRDGQTYKTVTIGSHTWMAENLNYKTNNSWCYKNKLSNCSTVGRLYNWNSASNACPIGWHLPNYKEWEQLINYLGGTENASYSLKSKEGWEWNGEVKGSNRSGLNILPAGIHAFYGFIQLKNQASYWSSSKSGTDGYYLFSLIRSYDGVGIDVFSQSTGLSVRCIKN